MRELELDPIPAEALDGVWRRHQRLGDAIDEALDWIEADPPDSRAKRHRFTNGMWAIAITSGGENWTIVWEESEPDRPVVRLLAETSI